MKRYQVIEAPHSIDHRKPDIVGPVAAFNAAIALGDRIAVYEWDGRGKHWDLIIDRTMHDSGRLSKIAQLQNWLNVVQLRRACNIEVGTGRPGYRWGQGWVYTTPTGGESIPERLSDARNAAQQDFPAGTVILERAT